MELLSLCRQCLLKQAQGQFVNKRTFHATAVYWCHYRVLGVKRDASQTEIKTAFVKLSKELHPDVSPDPKTHEKFVKLNEAYTVLSKPTERLQYDEKINMKPSFDNMRANMKSGPSTRQRYTSSTESGEFDEERMRAEQEYWNTYIVRPKVKPTKRFKNSTMVIGILVFALVGNGLQFLIFRYSRNKFNERAVEESRQINSLYKEIRRKALSPAGKEERQALIERMLEKEKINLSKYNRTLSRKVSHDSKLKNQPDTVISN